MLRDAIIGQTRERSKVMWGPLCLGFLSSSILQLTHRCSVLYEYLRTRISILILDIPTKKDQGRSFVHCCLTAFINADNWSEVAYISLFGTSGLTLCFLGALLCALHHHTDLDGRLTDADIRSRSVMDSMRSLNTSLPTSSPKARSAQPPEQLLQAFKTAALSVTNLYKTAASDQARARQAGYQDALDDLLAFLDKQNLGLGDGEGWRVRKWATERLDGSPPAHNGSDTDDERGEIEKRARSSSPVIQRKSSRDLHLNRQATRSVSPVRTESAPPAPPTTVQQQSSVFPRPEAFTFRSLHPYPQDVDMQLPDPAISNTATQPEIQPQLQINTTTSSVRVDVVPRGSRTPHRHGHSSRHNTRSSTSTRNLGSGAGSKRRIPFGDFFDLGSLGDGKDGSGGGGKRGRFI